MPENTRHRSLLPPTILVGWATACALGMWQTAAHVSEPGPAGIAPQSLPPALAARFSASGPPPENLLVMAIHPQCPCTPASLAELAVLAREAPQLAVHVLRYRPSQAPPAEWREDLLASQLAEHGAWVIHDDQNGELAELLGARTSGHTLLFDSSRRLRFAGGITDARGHRDTTCSRQSLLRALREATKEPTVTPVFGCPIHTPCSCQP